MKELKKKHWLYNLGIIGCYSSMFTMAFMWGAYDEIIKGEGVYYFYLYLIHVFILLILSILILKLNNKKKS